MSKRFDFLLFPHPRLTFRCFRNPLPKVLSATYDPSQRHGGHLKVFLRSFSVPPPSFSIRLLSKHAFVRATTIFLRKLPLPLNAPPGSTFVTFGRQPRVNFCHHRLLRSLDSDSRVRCSFSAKSLRKILRSSVDRMVFADLPLGNCVLSKMNLIWKRCFVTYHTVKMFTYPSESYARWHHPKTGGPSSSLPEITGK